MKQNKKIKVGIIGVGQIGKHHLENYKNISDAEVIAASDVNEEELKKVSSNYNIPNYFTDFRKMLEIDEISAVDVCVHNNLHAPLTVETLKAGKHVYCEKPMAGSYRDAKTMLESAKRCKRKLSIQMSTLFSRETRVAETMIREGQLGKIYHARSTGFRRRGRPYVDGYGTSFFVQKKYSGGGTLYDMGVYHIGNVLFLLDNPKVLTISGKTYQETEVDPERKRKGNYDVEELAVAFVRMEKGISVDIIEAWAVHMNGFEGSMIFGNKGGIRLQPFGFFRNAGDLELDSTVNLDGANWRWHSIRKNADCYDSPQQHWIGALQGRVPLLPIAEVALNTMLISEGIYLSERLGREVSAEEVEKNSKSTAVKA